MTLSEIVYQIDGNLEVRTEGSVYRANLYDNTKTLVIVIKKEKETDERSEHEATAIGKTSEEALINLTHLLKGSVIAHDFPLMWTTSTHSLRIPETLTPN